MRRLLLMGGAAPKFALTATTTAPNQTLTLYQIKPVGGNLVVSWGDGQTTTVIANDTGQQTHTYAAAGVYRVTFDNPSLIRMLTLTDSKISANFNTNPLPPGLTNLFLSFSGLTWNANTNPMPSTITSLNLQSMTGFVYNANTNPLPAGITNLGLQVLPNMTWNANTNPMPSTITALTLVNMPGLTYNANTNPLPSGITYLSLQVLPGLTWNANTNAVPSGVTALSLLSLPGLTWAINADQPWPSGVTAAVVLTCPGVTVSAWTRNTTRSIRIESSLDKAKVDAIIAAIYANRANFTWATPSLDIFGGQMAAPSGAYAEENPPTTGQGTLYELVNDPGSEGFNKWTAAFASTSLGVLGDSISASAGNWNYLVAAQYTPATMAHNNHAVNAMGILTGTVNLAAQVLLAAGDNADKIIIALGTNDDNSGNMTTLQAAVEAGIAALKISNPAATIYYMNVLPRWTNSGGGTVVDKSNIRTAIAAACTAQSITCWDTFTTPWIAASDTSDGVHPTAAGAQKIADQVLALLAA